MPLKKEYSQNKELCKVTFLIPEELGNQFEKICVVGDFNKWKPASHRFTKKEKDGAYSVALMLDANKEYAFRYLGNGVNWFNEPNADKEVPSYYPGSFNSVVVT